MDDLQRFFQFRNHSILNYMLLLKALGDLEPTGEMPIMMVGYVPGETAPLDMFDSMKMAHQALEDSTANRYLVKALRTAMVDWLTGMALMIIDARSDEDDESVVEAWILDAATLSMIRCGEALAFARDIQSGEIDPEGYWKD